MLSLNYLRSIGFRYDSEDNLWYDENPLREMYHFRVGVSMTNHLLYNEYRFELFYDGYDISLGTYSTIESFEKAAFDYNGTIF